MDLAANGLTDRSLLKGEARKFQKISPAWSISLDSAFKYTYPEQRANNKLQLLGALVK